MIKVLFIQITGNMRFSSPFRDFERITMNVNNGKRDGLWLTHADMDLMAERFARKILCYFVV